MKNNHLVLGSTGLVGSRLIYHLSKNNFNTIALTRRKIENPPINVKELLIDFNSSLKDVPIPFCDHLYICMGTTIKAAGSKEAFRRVDLDYCVSIAEKAQEEGVTQVTIVSSVGANDMSNNFYLKVKGLLIKKILTMDFNTVNIYYPGLLIGKRNETRLLEYIGQNISPFIDALLIGKMKKYRSIRVDYIALHMIKSKMRGINHFYYEDFVN